MITIKLPLPVKISLNDYISGKMHWSKKNKIAQEYHQAFLEFKNKFEIPEENYPVSMTFIFRFKGKLLDIDNVGMSEKLLCDGLRHIGLLKDDSYNFYNEKHTYIEKGKKDEVEIIIV